MHCSNLNSNIRLSLDGKSLSYLHSCVTINFLNKNFSAFFFNVQVGWVCKIIIDDLCVVTSPWRQNICLRNKKINILVELQNHN